MELSGVFRETTCQTISSRSGKVLILQITRIKETQGRREALGWDAIDVEYASQGPLASRRLREHPVSF